MVGCLYELNGCVRAYPNIKNLKNKYPDAKIIKEVEDISNLDLELNKYLGIPIKEKPNYYD